MGGRTRPLVRAPRIPRRQRPEPRRDHRTLPPLPRPLRGQPCAAARLHREPRDLRQGRHAPRPARVRAPLRHRSRDGRARPARVQREHPRRHDRVADRRRLPHVRPRRRASGRHRSLRRAHLVRRAQLRRLQDRAPGAARQERPFRGLPAGRDGRPAALPRVRARSGGRRRRPRPRHGRQQEARRAGCRRRSPARTERRRAAQTAPRTRPPPRRRRRLRHAGRRRRDARRRRRGERRERSGRRTRCAGAGR